jgi:hypothetical protein
MASPGKRGPAASRRRPRSPGHPPAMGPFRTGPTALDRDLPGRERKASISRSVEPTRGSGQPKDQALVPLTLRRRGTSR